ncbi:N-6 DNA methylase [Streptomyces sp. NPDC088846]|uniref:N-6 DNA methylase n=1 Tax=Streptomyces sp. NPDC088846 TaxID=3365908 RepID=UPI003828A522
MFRRVWRAIDELGELTAPSAAYRLALQVIFLRAAWEPRLLTRSPWDFLTRAAAEARGNGRFGATESVLSEVWATAGVETFVQLGTRSSIRTPGLSGEADFRLAALITAVAEAESVEGMFDACLDRYSHQLGRGGDYCTPRSVAGLMAGLAAPSADESVLDPVCGSGGLLVEAARLVRAEGSLNDLPRVYGRDIDAGARQVSAMNSVLNSLRGDFGTGPTNSLLAGPTGLSPDVVLANPPFNMKNWGYEELVGDIRWTFGMPPKGNANFAWIQHILSELSPQGRAVVLLAEGATAKGMGGAEQEIRRRMVEADVLGGVVALPARLFPHTRVAANLWLLSKDKNRHPGWGRTSRRGEVLFVDARRLGRRTDGAQRHLTVEDVTRICRTFSAWRGDRVADGAVAGGEADTPVEEPEWCRTVLRDEIAECDYDLTPSRYVRSRSETSVRARGPAGDRNRGEEVRRELYDRFDEAAHINRRLRSVLGEP